MLRAGIHSCSHFTCHSFTRNKKPAIVYFVSFEWAFSDQCRSCFRHDLHCTVILVLVPLSHSYSYCPETLWVFSFFNISQVGHPIHSNVQLLFYLHVSNCNLTTTYILESWFTHPLFPFFFLSLFLFFPFDHYFFHHICIIMYPLRVVMLSSFAYSTLLFNVFRFVTASLILFYIPLYSFVMCKFAMIIC